MRLLLPLATLACFAPQTATAWSVDSSDTGAHAFTIWNDYATENRSTFLNDTATIDVALRAQWTDTYEWTFKPRVGDRLINPAPALYAEFRVYLENQLLGDLVSPGAVTPPLHFEAGQVLRFKLEYQIRAAADVDLDQIGMRVAANLAQEGQARRVDEVHAWLSLQPHGDANASQTPGAHVHVRAGLDLLMLYRLPRALLEFHAEPPRPVQGQLDSSSVWTYQGRAFELNAPAHVRVHAEGSLRDSGVAFFADNLGSPLATLGLPNIGTTSGRASEESPRLVLPAGRHRILYRIPAADGAPATGSVTFEHAGGQFRFVEALEPAVPERREFVYVAPSILLVAVALALAFGWWRSRSPVRPAACSGPPVPTGDPPDAPSASDGQVPVESRPSTPLGRRPK